MSDDLIARISSSGGEELSLAAGAYLFHQGDAVGRVFAVRGGRVHLVRHQEDGSALILQRAGPGEIVAEASVFSADYHCDGIAITGSALVMVPRQVLRDRFRNEPDLAEEFAAHLARQTQNARFRAEILSLRTVAARLDGWRAWHGALPPKGEWRQLADQIGVSPEALYRELGRRRR